jgi:hypothetical protein
MVVLLCVAAVEVAARIVTRGPRWVNPFYLEISSDFHGLESLISDNQRTFTAPKYYQEFVYSAAPISTSHVNFTDYFSARRTPSSAPLTEARNIVWAFGGSTFQNQETTDSLTIANIWARVFNRELGATHVKNFGTGSFFTSYELIKFQRLLREVPENERPTIAIFYDGYNDANNGLQDGAGRMQTDLSLKLQSLVEQKYHVLWTYAVSETLSRYLESWELTGARFVERILFPPATPQADEENLNGAVRVYVDNVRMIEGTCAAFRVECFFILQPLLVTKVPLVGIERDVLENLERHPRYGRDGVRFVREFYARVAGTLRENNHFIDGSAILNDRTRPDFYDLGHVAAETPPIIGERLANMILGRLGRGSSTSG